jgi:hypothetical protein
MKTLEFDDLGRYIKKIYSGEFADQYPPGWGRANDYRLHEGVSIQQLIPKINPKTILDYGCGESTVTENLQQHFPNITYTQYDPYVEKYNHYPQGHYDFVMCNLVIHLLNEKLLVHTINELHRLTRDYLFVSVVVLNNDTDFSFEDRINHWHNNFKNLFEITEQGLILPNPELFHLKNRCIVTFLLKKLSQTLGNLKN